MQLNDILDSLGYRDSPNFLRLQDRRYERDSGHILRKAEAECGLRGAYVVNGAAYDGSSGNVPSGMVILRGANPAFPDIVIRNDGQGPVQILGKYVGLIRSQGSPH